MLNFVPIDQCVNEKVKRIRISLDWVFITFWNESYTTFRGNYNSHVDNVKIDILMVNESDLIELEIMTSEEINQYYIADEKYRQESLNKRERQMYEKLKQKFEGLR